MYSPITYKLSAIAMLFLMIFTGLKAQNQISGTIIDENNLPLSYAGVMLLQASDSLLIKGEVSDDEGHFSFKDIPAGEYVVGISMISYDDLFTAAFTLDTDTQQELGTLQLRPGATDLAEVEVVAKKPLFEQRIDRLVVNVAQSVTSAGSTALEVLERSPGVVVNRQANDISISGRSGVVVMINNKISRLPIDAIIQQLEAMPADNVERIEVITTPPANFDAEGNAGIISIILRKNLAEGLNGTANVSAGYGFHEKWGGNFNFNYRKGKWNVFGDYGTDYNETYQQFTSYRGFTNAAGNFIENDNVSDRDPIQKNQNGRLGVDFQLTDRTVVGVLGSWSERDWHMDAVNTVDRSENNQLVDRLIIDNDEDNVWRNWLANINVQHELKNNGRLNFDLDYTSYDNTNPSNYINNFFNPEGNQIDQTALRVRKDTPIDIYVFKADYSQELSEGLSIEAGLKGNFSEFGNDFSVENLEEDLWVSDPQFTANYSLMEYIGAAYATASWQITPKTGLKAGLRYEYTDSELGSETQPKIVDRTYGNLFPSLFLSRDLAEQQQLQFSYSRRINRPDFTQLAPFVIFVDPNTLLSGNVALQPAYTDALRLGYRYKSYFFSLDYGYTNDAISRFQPQVDQETNQQINASVNMEYQQNLSASISFPLQLTDWWSMRNNIVGFWQENRIPQGDESVNISATTLRVNHTQTFQLPSQWSAEFSAFYMSPVAFGLVISKPFGDLALGFQKKFGESRSSMSINFTNLLQTYFRSEIEDDNVDFAYRGQFGFAERRVRVTYTYNFGNQGVKANRQRSTGSEEERRRVGQ